MDQPGTLWQVLALPVIDLDFEMSVGCCVVSSR
jgi:hypothetical protein